MNGNLTGASQEEIRANLTAALVVAYRQLLEAGTTSSAVHVQLEFALMQAGVDLSEAIKDIQFGVQQLAKAPVLSFPNRAAPASSTDTADSTGAPA